MINSNIDIVAVITEEWHYRRDLIVSPRFLHLSQLPASPAGPHRARV